MKASNLVTPRSLTECHFNASADPIERPVSRRISGFTCTLIAVALLALSGGLAACIAP